MHKKVVFLTTLRRDLGWLSNQTQSVDGVKMILIQKTTEFSVINSLLTSSQLRIHLRDFNQEQEDN